MWRVAPYGEAEKTHERINDVFLRGTNEFCWTLDRASLSSVQAIGQNVSFFSNIGTFEYFYC